MADSFSNLPEPIIHHIMSFLPSTRDAMALSMLSRTLSSAFLCFPIIEFDINDLNHYFFCKSRTKARKLDNLVDYLKRHRMIRLDNLRFVARDAGYLFRNRIETLFTFAIDNNVKELELDFGKYGTPEYTLPQELFSSKTIRVLTIKGLELGLYNQDLIVSSPSLENLSLINSKLLGIVSFVCNGNLKQVEIDFCREIHIEGQLPCLEYFSSPNCKLNISSSNSLKLKHLQICSNHDSYPLIKLYDFSRIRFLETLKLKGRCKLIKEIKFHLEYLNALDFVKVEIEAPNLASLIYKSISAGPLEINISSSSANLKHLHFEGANVPRRWIANNFIEFCFLETLKLRCSHRLVHVKFHLEYLNALELDSVDFLKVEIEAPNLVSLTYISKYSGPPEINISSSSTNLKHLQFNGDSVPQR